MVIIFFRKPNIKANCYHLIIFFLLHLIVTLAKGSEPPGLQSRKNFLSARPGDINLGLLAGIHSYDSTGRCTSSIPWFVCTTLVSVNLAIDRINNRTDILPNISIGLTSLDTCNTPNNALEVAMLFVTDSQANANIPQFDYSVGLNSNHSFANIFDVVGIVGPIGSAESIAVSPLMGLYKKPVIGLRSTIDDLSDKTLYPYFTRLVSTDSFMTKALVDLANTFGWTYLSIVYSEGSYGENGASQTSHWIRNSGPQYNICLAVSIRIPSAAIRDDYLAVVSMLMDNSKARVVIAFMGNADMFNLFPLVEQIAGAGSFLWLAADSFAVLIPLTVVRSLTGSIYVDHPGNPIPGYDDYIYSSTFWDLKNVWIAEIWQKTYNCVISDDSAVINGKRCVFNAPQIDATCLHGWTLSDRAYDAIFVMAHALHNLIAANCPESFRDTTLAKGCIDRNSLLSYVLNVTMNGSMGAIKFDEQGDVLEDLVVKQIQILNGTSVGRTIGRWDPTTGLSLLPGAIDWTIFYKNISTINTSTKSLSESDHSNHSVVPLESVCSKPCADSEYIISQSSPCCWQCATCRSNEFIIPNRTGCKSCPAFTWPLSVGASSCAPISPVYLHLSDPISIVMICFAIFGAIFTLSVMVVYKVRGDHQLVKATSRELCYIILCGTLLVSAVVILFVVKPDSNGICSARSIGFHFSINLIYAPLLVKNVRIYRLFESAQKSNKRPSWTSTSWQMLFTFLVVAIQVVITVLLEVIQPSISALVMPSPYASYVEIYCSNTPLTFLAPLSYNILLILTCTIIGFITRKLPDNFNESWFIFLSAATTLFSWAVFVPAYFTTVNAYLQSAILGCCLILNCFINLGCLFGPILYAVAFVPNARIKIVVVNTNSTMIGLDTMSAR